MTTPAARIIARPPVAQQTRQAHQPRAYTLNPVTRTGPQYPDVSRDQLVEALRLYFHEGMQPHPRLKWLQNGVAIFKGYFVYNFNTKTKIGYDIICHVPLTDEMFQTGQAVDLLYCNDTCRLAQFRPVTMQDKKGCGLDQPQY